jgi:redox-sensitive bicupin YhaK (pirin superfamily)
MASGVELMIEPRTRAVGNGTVQRLLPWRGRRMVGPFIFVDHIGPEEVPAGAGIDVDAHPHIGLSTVTYLFEGRMRHRDSTGAVATIEPGAVNWMTAGSGVAHTERSLDEDRPNARRQHGLQTWVALPGGAENTAPFFEHHAADTIPVADVDGVRVRIAAGTGWGLTSPVKVSSPLVLAEIDLGADGALAVDTTHAERAVLALDGALTVGGQTLPHGALAVLEKTARPEVRGSGRLVVLGGEPVGARFIWWNFVHSDPERIEEAKADWTAQTFPRVPGDHDPWVPLPG